MREIKFRAWDEVHKQMLYIGLELDTHIGGPQEDLMQYTGLKDKNGVEIYEGDIVSMFQGTQLSEVFFSKGMFLVNRGFRASVYHSELEIREEILFNIIDTCEVIGNIYENPELLEDTQ
ncbi:YopX family protein [Chryseomicrobium palamuruense]